MRQPPTQLRCNGPSKLGVQWMRHSFWVDGEAPVILLTDPCAHTCSLMDQIRSSRARRPVTSYDFTFHIGIPANARMVAAF